jgi:thiamine-monophosphate kinase
MQLSHIGELALLSEIRSRFGFSSRMRDSGIVIGIGDDAAVIGPQCGNILVTTDTMNEGVHFDLGFTSAFQLGFKLVSVNVSDIMAMCGRPQYLFLNLSLRNDTGEEFFRSLYDGIAAALDLYGVRLLGGDLTAARNDTVLSATVLGSAGKVVCRSGAAPGDRIYVSAATGDSACGLEILKRLTPASRDRVRAEKFSGLPDSIDEKRDSRLAAVCEGVPVALDWKVAAPLIKRHLMPVARDSAGLLPYATSLIDVSDGLFIDLCRICDESGVGARVYRDKIPLSQELKSASAALGLDPFLLVSSGGEDYELLFTAPHTPPIPPLLGVKITCIGEITERDRVLVDADGRETELKAEGYRHFGAQG